MSRTAKLVGMVLRISDDPGRPGRIADTVDAASQDAEALLEAGFRTVMVPNLASPSPWRHETVEDAAAAGVLLGRPTERLPGAEWGLNLPSDDPEASIAIAHEPAPRSSG